MQDEINDLFKKLGLTEDKWPQYANMQEFTASLKGYYPDYVHQKMLIVEHSDTKTETYEELKGSVD